MDDSSATTSRNTDRKEARLSSNGSPPEPRVQQEDLSSVTKDIAASTTTTTTTTAAGLLQRCTDAALSFLGHASNETLGACLVGLGAGTYFVLGRVGLLVIGVAGGVVLHATWEGVRYDDRSEAAKAAEQEKRREAGVEVVRRILQWRKDNAGEEDTSERGVLVFANKDLDFSSFEPKTETALNAFADALITDYVRYWYSPTVPDEETFPTQCRRTLTAFILSVSGHLQRKRPTDAFLDFVTNASSLIVVFLSELAVALNASPNSPPADAVKFYLDNKPDSNLAHLLDKKYQDRRLSTIAEDILESYLDPKSFNCPPVHTFLKEILAQLVLGHTITLCSAPDWINDYIIYGLEESKTTKEVMDIVDASVESKGVVPVDKQDDPAPSTESGAADALDKVIEDEVSAAEHNRHFSRAEEAMDEAMQEAKRLTQLMIEEDERRAREEQERLASSSREDESSPSQGLATPTSSESEHDRQLDRSSLASSDPSTAPTSEQADDSAPVPSTPTASQQFTSFDQILPDSRPTALSASPESKRDAVQLTLYNASIAIFDDSLPGEKASIKAKPTTDYLIQIEPASGAFPGWMIARKYADFEMLHEVLRRISVITGATFTESHKELPKWKVHTKISLRQELERYLMDAVRFQQLAESEGMKRFLEKDQALLKGPNKGFGWPTPEAFGRLGGDVINVLAKAPKDVAGGGKALFGGLKGSKKSQTSGKTNSAASPAATPSSESRKSMQFPDVADSAAQGSPAKFSEDSLRTSLTAGEEQRASSPLPSSEGRPSIAALPNDLVRTESHTSQTSQPQREIVVDPQTGIEDTIELPPPPSEMPDDYDSQEPAAESSTDRLERSSQEQTESTASLPKSTKPPAQKKPIMTEQEASVAIELMFAVINELYTLSSAWQFRKTLLAAAKSYLLRPGNLQLIAIRDLLQKDLLEANLSDEGIAAQIYKMRENALPTEEEMVIWRRDYPEKTAEQKEEARIKARKLLVTKGMPAALTSVMGAAASGEALGRVFDCLQMPEISRGLIFGLMHQALKVVTH